jgi:hypothetical protein
LPERVRLVGAPGGLRDRELEVLGWRTEAGETALICRLVDGSAGTIPARWTDLRWRVEPEPVGGALGSPAGWRLLLERGERLRGRRPRRGRASGENGGGDVGPARARDRRAALVPAAVWETLPPERQLEVTLRLARLLARMVEGERDE